MQISSFARRTGLSPHTIRYYESLKILTDIPRDRAGRRVFGEPELEWVSWIIRLKSTGMSLADIRRFAGLRRQGDSSFRARRDMLGSHATVLEAEIARLQGELDIVRRKIASYQKRLEFE